MGRVIDVIFYSEMMVVFYLFVIDPLIYLLRHHDGLLPMLSEHPARRPQRCPPPPPPHPSLCFCRQFNLLHSTSIILHA